MVAIQVVQVLLPGQFLADWLDLQQPTFNQWVTGSNPVRLTNKINDLAEIIYKPLKLWVPNGFQNRAAH